MSAAQVPGVTDRRWEGVIATVRQDKGFGFIRCPELRKMYPEKDVFLHQRHLGSFREGDNVSFGVFMRDGKPQATDLAMVNGQQPMQQQQQMAPQMGMQMGMPMGQGVPMQGMGMGMGMGMQMDMGMQQPSMGHPQAILYDEMILRWLAVFAELGSNVNLEQNHFLCNGWSPLGVPSNTNRKEAPGRRQRNADRALQVGGAASGYVVAFLSGQRKRMEDDSSSCLS
ncbi:unnamed protein product [Effrenium voratum]|nr:unnamed protein product [Effrenium voratum]